MEIIPCISTPSEPPSPLLKHYPPPLLGTAQPARPPLSEPSPRSTLLRRSACRLGVRGWRGAFRDGQAGAASPQRGRRCRGPLWGLRRTGTGSSAALRSCGSPHCCMTSARSPRWLSGARSISPINTTRSNAVSGASQWGQHGSIGAPFGVPQPRIRQGDTEGAGPKDDTPSLSSVHRR
jgi:hypothetical protein